ncbi:MAG: M1 family metallopeptidase [Flavobacteriales bacterium]|jgi:hypothetical protein
MRKIPLAAVFALAISSLSAQCDGWQQHITCSLSVELDVATHLFTGTEELTYVNNSPDTLRELFFHLYLNAFKPGSEMDVRSRTVLDPDPRVGDRIASLTPDEVGDLQCRSMQQESKAVTMETMGTVMRATLPTAVAPGDSTRLSIGFSGQVPLQIRRTGRDNAEGIAYSMAQWFPKVAAYDERGWHADPYVGREFYGEWGNYEVAITLDSSYTVAATGVLANADEIGHGYAPLTRPQQRKDGKLTWRFSAPRVHDFAWSADPHYKHVTAQVPNGPLLRFIYLDKPEYAETWGQLPSYMVRAVELLNKDFGTYPWPVFTFAQGGDGGMEYPMFTLITGERRLGSLIGTSLHEITHNWYYGVLASDELSYPWMDEGFSEYAGEEVIHQLLPASKTGRDHAESRMAYLNFLTQPDNEPMTVEADHFSTNRSYSVTAYSKGEFLLDQLGAVIGDSTLHRGLLRYFDACAFKHPGPIDVQRAMEKESGLQLGWYFKETLNTVRAMDYAVDSLAGNKDSTVITLANNGLYLMPVDVEVLTTGGKSHYFNIPLSLMLGARKEMPMGKEWSTLKPWQWTDPYYTFTLPIPLKKIRQVQMDPFERMGDADRGNDKWSSFSDMPEHRND